MSLPACFAISKHLAAGDMVTVARIDRLARSTFDLSYPLRGPHGLTQGQFDQLWARCGIQNSRIAGTILVRLGADEDVFAGRRPTAEDHEDALQLQAGAAEWVGHELVSEMLLVVADPIHVAHLPTDVAFAALPHLPGPATGSMGLRPRQIPAAGSPRPWTAVPQARSAPRR